MSDIKSNANNASLPNVEQPTLLIVDDDPALRERLARAFGKRGFEVMVAGGRTEANAAANHDSPEFAIVDLKMTDGNGLEVVRDLIAIDPQTKVLVLTGYGSIATAVDAVKLGALSYLSKPADVDDILAAFDRGEGEALDPSRIDYKAPSLARVEWEHINRVLADCGNNISEAARRLGIHRRSLQRKLQKYAPR